MGIGGKSHGVFQVGLFGQNKSVFRTFFFLRDFYGRLFQFLYSLCIRCAIYTKIIAVFSVFGLSQLSMTIAFGNLSDFFLGKTLFKHADGADSFQTFLPLFVAVSHLTDFRIFLLFCKFTKAQQSVLKLLIYGALIVQHHDVFCLHSFPNLLGKLEF